jgi:hypothetical protein
MPSLLPEFEKLPHGDAVCREHPTTTAAAVTVVPAATRSQRRRR